MKHALRDFDLEIEKGGGANEIAVPISFCKTIVNLPQFLSRRAEVGVCLSQLCFSIERQQLRLHEDRLNRVPVNTREKNY
jgi:hypothetical protein